MLRAVERRRVLGAGVAVLAATASAPLLAACTGGANPAAPAISPSSTSPVASNPRRTAADLEAALATQAADVAHAHPALRARLQPVVDAHLAHVAALTGTTPTATPTGAAPETSGQPATAVSALRDLSNAERALGTQHARSAATAAPADARLIASLAAYAAAQAMLLSGGAV